MQEEMLCWPQGIISITIMILALSMRYCFCKRPIQRGILMFWSNIAKAIRDSEK